MFNIIISSLIRNNNGPVSFFVGRTINRINAILESYMHGEFDSN